MHSQQTRKLFPTPMLYWSTQLLMNTAITWKSTGLNFSQVTSLWYFEKVPVGHVWTSLRHFANLWGIFNAVKKKLPQAKWIAACLISQRQFHYANPTQDPCGEILQNFGIAAYFNCFHSSLCEKLIKQNLEESKFLKMLLTFSNMYKITSQASTE